jgi:hypothetical protein
MGGEKERASALGSGPARRTLVALRGALLARLRVGGVLGRSWWGLGWVVW